MKLKKTAVLFMALGLLAGCESWNMPDEEEIFEVKDEEYSREWAVDGMDGVSESYLYNIDTKIYEIVARRTTNKLLNYAAPVADTVSRPTVFVSEAQVYDTDLPDGFAYSRKITKDMLENAKAFMVVNDPAEADYFVDIDVETLLPEGSNTPIIIYTLVLSDNNDEVLQEWKETIRQVKNDDRSWW
ncbi:MAG: hypothetical protein J6L86_04440 [Alphaproteobacteria bacterium]|nr:hypothetical protein [Alphaproteobacteria bacterium]MBQ8630821.1 hypothetical protein [Alphaproteobacteria bacterium]